MNAVELAWLDESPDTSYYLDTESGCVEMVQQGLIDLRDLTDMIENDRERYLYIPKPKVNQAKQDMADFIETLEDEKLSRLLPLAMESPNAVYACRTILATVPEQLERWEKFRQGRTRIRIKQWMSANFIEEVSDFSPG